MVMMMVVMMVMMMTMTRMMVIMVKDCWRERMEAYFVAVLTTSVFNDPGLMKLKLAYDKSSPSVHQSLLCSTYMSSPRRRSLARPSGKLPQEPGWQQGHQHQRPDLYGWSEGGAGDGEGTAASPGNSDGDSSYVLLWVTD
jgi:hypothetical protein